MSGRAATTPEPVIDAAVRAICGRGVEGLTRVTSGGLNETYRAALRGGEPVVVRIARRPERWFTQEASAVATARSVGVPAPDVLGVAHVEHAGALLSFSVLSVVPGRPLDEMAGALAASELERLVEEAGALLARLHSASFGGGLRHGLDLPDEAALARAARAADEALGRAGAEAVARGADLVRARAAAQRPAARLAHGDWLPKHIMVDGASIAGVIDWEFAGSASPARAFARWEVSAGDLRALLPALRRGYARLSDPDAVAYPDEVAAFAVAWGLEVLGWRDPASPEYARRCLGVVMRHAGRSHPHTHPAP